MFFFTIKYHIFFRIDKDLEVTGTFKLKKAVLKSNGFNPESNKDSEFYVVNHKSKSYIKITKQLYKDIESGELRL